MEKKDLTNFLDSMIGNIEKKEIELFKKIIETSEIDNFQDHEDFFYSVLYPFDKFVNGFIKTEICNNRDVVFLIKNQNFIKHNFSKIIIKKEGTACSSDKSRTIMKRLINYYKTGENIEFDYNQEYTYHLPKKVFTKHEDIVRFYESLKSLYYGSFENYLNVLKEIIIDEEN